VERVMKMFGRCFERLTKTARNKSIVAFYRDLVSFNNLIKDLIDSWKMM
jgi:hypothetical protein